LPVVPNDRSVTAVTGAAAPAVQIDGSATARRETPKMSSQPRRDVQPATLTDDQLAELSGGPTEELFGSYHFGFEVAGGDVPGPVIDRFRPPLGSGKGS